MTSVGASEVAVILGVQRRREDGDPYCSEIELWGRLTGLLPRYDGLGGPDAECGRWFEPAVLNRYAIERGLTWGSDFFPGPSLEQEPARVDGIPWHARWDAFNGRDNRSVEAKCPRVLDPERWGEPGTDQVPVDHAVQVACQLAIAFRLWGTELGDLAAFARSPGWGSDQVWAVYTLRRDPQVEAGMASAVRRWLEEHVERGDPPAVDGSASATSALRRMWAPADARVLTAGQDELELYRRLLQVRTARQEVEGRLEELRQRIQLAMQDSTELRDQAGDLLATWRPDITGRRRFLVRRRNETFDMENDR
jgi:hypothetical protein